MVCEILLEEFKNIFCLFRKVEIQLKLFSDRFSMEYDKVQEEYQLELIEISGSFKNLFIGRTHYLYLTKIEFSKKLL